MNFSFTKPKITTFTFYNYIRMPIHITIMGHLVSFSFQPIHNILRQSIFTIILSDRTIILHICNTIINISIQKINKLSISRIQQAIYKSGCVRIEGSKCAKCNIITAYHHAPSLHDYKLD